MLFFKSVAVFATVAFSAISAFAAPTAEADTTALVKKAQPSSIPQIFAGATTSLQAPTKELRAYTIITDLVS
jgi:hypothetical protein